MAFHWHNRHQLPICIISLRICFHDAEDTALMLTLQIFPPNGTAMSHHLVCIITGYKKRTVFIVITLFIEPDEHQMLRCHKFAFVGV